MNKINYNVNNRRLKDQQNGIQLLIIINSEQKIQTEVDVKKTMKERKLQLEMQMTLSRKANSSSFLSQLSTTNNWNSNQKVKQKKKEK